MFRAYDPQQDRLVAVKLFRLDLAPERVHKLVAGLEGLVAADLGHPAIATPIAAGMVDLSAYLAQDFVAADSLDTVVREFGGAPPADAARVAAQLAGALDFAAAVGVHHGALHPRDVLLASDDARLTGLGVAQILESLGAAVPVRRPYAAPERVAGQAWDRRADVYSLAVLMAEMIAGRRPSSIASLDTLFESLGAPRDAVKSVFAKAMAEQPGDRYDTALAFADALKQAVAGDGVAADEAVATSAAMADPHSPIAPPPVSAPAVPQPLAARLPLDEPTLGPSEALLPGDMPPLRLEADAFHADDLPIAPHAGNSALDAADWDLRGGRAGDHDLELDRDAGAEDEALLPNLMTDASAADGPGGGPRVSPPGDASASARASVDGEAPAPVAPAVPPPLVARAPTTPPGSPSVWPIPVALLVGLIVGIAVGFFIFGSRPGSEADEVAISTTPAASAGTPAPAAGTPPAQPAAAAGTAAPAPTATSPAAAAAPAPEAAPATPGTSGSAGAAGAAGAAASAAAAAAPASPVTRPPASAPATPAPPARARENARRETPPRPAADRREGRLLVRSSPAGARVLLDGQDVGVTPVTLRALPPGAHTVRLTRDGYVAEERRVTISASQPSQSVLVDLARERRTPPASQALGAGYQAALVVESRPAGAAVFLDGRRVGTTPLTVDSVPTGSHVVRLELDGYRRWSSSVRVAAGERNRVTASLEQ